MNKKNTVFVGIWLIYNQDIFSSVEVATTLKGLCRVMGVKYEATAKSWKRKGKDEEIDVWNENKDRWRIFEKEVDTIWGRGDKEIGKKTAGMRGYKHDDGRLHDKPQKRTLADDVIVNYDRGEPGEFGA